MILGDRDLKYYIEKGLIVIEPYDPEIIRENGIDLRVGNQIARLKRTNRILDVKANVNLEDFYQVEEGESFIIHPGERVLLTTLEYLKLSEDIMAFVELRSTYARLGLSMPPCISQDTYLLLGDGNVKTAGEVKDHDTVLHVNANNQTLKPVKPKTYRSKYKYMLKVTTEHSEIIVTPNHKFLAICNGTLCEAPASMLKRGCYVAVPRRVRLGLNRSSIRMLKESNVKNNEDYNLLNQEVKAPLEIERTFKINELLAWIVGYIIGCGRVDPYNNMIYVTDRRAGMLRELMRRLKIVFNVKDLSYDQSTYTLKIKGITAELLINRFPELKLNIEDRLIPSDILKCSNRILASFIAGLYDARGSIAKSSISIDVDSYKLAKYLQLSLLRLGILSSLSKIKSSYNLFKVEIRGRKNIGMFIKKTRNLRTFKINLDKNFKDEAVPLTYNLIKLLEKVKKSLGKRLSSLTIKNNEIAYSTLKKVVEKLKQNNLVHEDLWVKKFVNEAKLLLSYGWSRVIRVSEVNGDFEIVDFEVPQPHLYLTDIFITHNTIVDAGFEGNITLEVIGGSFRVKIYSGERFAHIIFAKTLSPVERPYKGRYQGQKGVTLPKLT